MKKYLLYFLFCLVASIPLNSHAQDYELGYCCFYDGYWGNWNYTRNYKIWGNYDGFIMYISYNHPSDYCFKFQINSYIQPSKDEIKAHWKSKQPFVYYGTVEYYVSYTYNVPTAKDVLKEFGMPYLTAKGDGLKKVASAEIRIMPYKKHPKCYNIFYDNVGFAISLGIAEFPE